MVLSYTQTGQTNNEVSDNDLYIAARIANCWIFYKGIIDEVRIYNRALSDQEIKALI
ncbi:MAG: hypothetical protein KatS3mg096_125 [Candidatus Parcubacteria bacterium]|nr:MAG: hypothetical protein KatS3mg096_125 [Candidatus Parcubacteria bacterium]